MISDVKGRVEICRKFISKTQLLRDKKKAICNEGRYFQRVMMLLLYLPLTNITLNLKVFSTETYLIKTKLIRRETKTNPVRHHTSSQNSRKSIMTPRSVKVYTVE